MPTCAGMTSGDTAAECALASRPVTIQIRVVRDGFGPYGQSFKGGWDQVRLRCRDHKPIHIQPNSHDSGYGHEVLAAKYLHCGDDRVYRWGV